MFGLREGFFWRILATGVLLAEAAVAVACGSAGAGERSASTSCEPAFDRTTRALRDQAGCQVDVAVAVDATAFGHGASAADRASTAVIGAIRHTAFHGGELVVTVFGKAAARELQLVAASVDGKSEIQRVSHAKPMIRVVSAAVRSVYLPEERSADLDRQIRLLGGDGGGTDAGRATKRALEAATVGEGGSAAVVLTDGVIQTPEFNLASELRGGSSSGALAQKILKLIKPDGPKVDLLVVEGLGAVPPHLRNRWTPEHLDRLEEAWSISCRKVARRCAVTTGL